MSLYTNTTWCEWLQQRGALHVPFGWVLTPCSEHLWCKRSTCRTDPRVTTFHNPLKSQWDGSRDEMFSAYDPVTIRITGLWSFAESVTEAGQFNYPLLTTMLSLRKGCWFKTPGTLMQIVRGKKKRYSQIIASTWNLNLVVEAGDSFLSEHTFLLIFSWCWLHNQV